ncbi:MAG TPA: anaerobic sulfatase maturase, partial [Burkholderiales bacterium]|nr:anaerobic sulfatase maturase [Burkholderiales bacterium]
MTVSPREFQVMAKPIGAVCNLDCRYCYYLEKRALYPDSRTFRMPDDLLERYIVQHIDACPTETVLFAWHGGEPTVLGIDYFRRIIELQRRHAPAGKRVVNGIQTNGTLLTEEWARFLSEEHFYVGLSLDGPRELHDRYRVTQADKATHRQVVQAFRLLQQHQVSCDVLCVVHHQNVRQPLAVYRFFRDLGVEYLQFLPMVARDPAGAASALSVSGEAYGEFLCIIFREWIRHDVGRMGVQNFDEALRPFIGMPHALCIQRETCGDIVVLEHNGDVYACDHFVTPEYRLGNVRETTLSEILESPQLHAFGQAKRDRLPRYCRECEVLACCNGGCPKDRIDVTADGESGLNHLCTGLKRFFIMSA